MRNCNRKRDRYEEERVVKGEQLTNNNSTESKNSDTNTHMRILATKNISDKDGRATIWLGKELKKAVIKANINLSEFVRSRLLEELKNRNIEVEIPDPELILRVRCPRCGSQGNTSSIVMARCFNCKHSFRIYKKGSSRIVGIVKGNLELLHKLYYKEYGRR
ncbi:MAG: hypothetical protein QXM38_03370 [Candidatus Aenigmatarchaeota archaeon]